MKKMFTLLEFGEYLLQYPLILVRIQKADQEFGEEAVCYNFDCVFHRIIPMQYTNGICLRNDFGFFRLNMVRGILVEREQESCFSKLTVFCGGTIMEPDSKVVLMVEHEKVPKKIC